MIDACLNPELAAEITCQPVRRHGVDGAVFFSDIMIPLVLAGVDVTIRSGVGPVIAEPVRSPADVEALVCRRIDDGGAIERGVELAVRELGEATPVIGFAGGPFTLAAYLVEGRGSRDHLAARAFMHAEPAAWRRLMTWCAELSGQFLRMQVASGARAVQLFDSWAGALSLDDYARGAAPYSRLALQAVRGGAAGDGVGGGDGAGGCGEPSGGDGAGGDCDEAGGRDGSGSDGVGGARAGEERGDRSGGDAGVGEADGGAVRDGDAGRFASVDTETGGRGEAGGGQGGQRGARDDGQCAVVPRIHFGTGTGHLLEIMAGCGCEAVGIDYRTPLDEAARRLPRKVLQGNIDPARLAAGWDSLRTHALDVIERGRAAPAHVVNLGHGVPPSTDPAVLTDLVALVHES